MNIDDIDLVKLSKLLSIQTDFITCLECCKYYVAPETATCGHTLCRSCWLGCKVCSYCNATVDRKQTKKNLPLQKLMEHIQALSASYEKLFNTKMVDILMENPETESEKDPAKNVMKWLTSSQNHFSAPAQSSDQSSQDMQHNSIPIQVPPTNIQIHAPPKKTRSPEKVLHASLPQDDWDKIEVMPDIDTVEKNKENIIGPMDIEPFYVDDNEYTVTHPRRSSRKRELMSNDLNINNNSTKKSKDSSGELDKKSNTAKQNWNNVKKMKKEFSKLNKLNRNKLNVSIEMCKKTQQAKALNVLHNVNIPQVYDIDENTPNETVHDVPQVQMISPEYKTSDKNTNLLEPDKDNLHDLKNNDAVVVQTTNMSQSLLANDTTKSIVNHVKQPTSQCHEPPVENVHKLPFYKKSALCTTGSTRSDQIEEMLEPKTINHHVESNTTSNEDIEITIKVGNTITNIVIKKKNDVQMKVNTDREVQTSLDPYIDQAPTPPQIETRNVFINIDSNNEVNIEHKLISKENESIPSIKQVFAEKVCAKKNTPSADTGTGPFEITESVEKELSNIVECAEMADQQKTNSHSSCSNKKLKTSTLASEKPNRKNSTINKTTYVSQIKNTPDIIDLEASDSLKDADIFESDTVKENVQMLKFTKNNTPSEILTSTAHNRNKSQKEKRNRCSLSPSKDDLPSSKKQKLNETNKKSVADRSKLSKQIQPDSEVMNYDSIMGHVFANIDADMEEIKSQKVTKKHPPNTHKSIHEKSQVIQKQNIDKEIESVEYDIVIDNEYENPKDSENIFSVCVDKEDVNEASAPKKDQVCDIEPRANIDDFLTPVMGTNRESASVAIVEINNDDSDSVVEDTPQKDTSFGKPKPKSITNSSQRLRPQPRVTRESEPNNKVILANTTDHTTNDITIIETAKETLETPLNINKFVNSIKHNSTPVARKSLTFESEDTEHTICPTSEEKTTQEKDFLKKAFDKTPTLQVKPLKRTDGGKKFCITGSCLSSAETARVRALCAHFRWTFVDQYRKELTHLVVGVNEENRSSRTIKYMCALAAAKWIVTSAWVERCLEAQAVVGEEEYEALDFNGQPGPRRSRAARRCARPLFHGISFYCMEPFSVLDAATLKEILESSGGRVVGSPAEVRVTEHSPAPALLLAEPENTQDDQFIYLAMESSIVPVNYEWVLNCLGSYTISSIHDLLICPPSLLPKATKKWPAELIDAEED